MPTYVVTSIEKRFSPDQKSRLAAAITDIHCTVTGALPYLVHVVFDEVPFGNYFVGGKHLKYDNVMVLGHIRGGRHDELKKRLVIELMHAVAAIGETDRTAIQVYIADVPARQIAEWGRILPQPGQEQAWDAKNPEDVRKRIKTISS